MAVFLRKLKEFGELWLVYLFMVGAIALLAVFVITPALGFLRFGVFVFVPEWGYVIKILRAVLFGSLALAVVMWVWGALSDAR
ncbi:MAG: hypothetical protein Q7V20_20090 [Aquabacterium sp.]|uniref:hypothetical protein n=1 Tax=Aquabacterium sp. TaxID=1872578 RepID=UPI00271F99EA|nr:hypothetical protein [Aquabacterium sp.]MDO9005752.1 hypothetical protein [Aquabacterium sp.]